MKTIIYGNGWAVFANEIETGDTSRREYFMHPDYMRVIIASDNFFEGK